jgi:acyl-CoA hydrolase
LFDEHAERFAGYSDRSVSLTVAAANKKIEQDVARAAESGTVSTVANDGGGKPFASPGAARPGKF